MSNAINEHAAHNSPALRPCPFCGSSASMRHGARYGHWVQCDKCGAGHPFAFGTEAEAIAAWNRRAPEADMADNDELEDAVRIMRAAQKEYFRTRAPSALSAAKKAEREVDEMLNPKPVRENDARQMKFDFTALITDAERETADLRAIHAAEMAERDVRRELSAPGNAAAMREALTEIADTAIYDFDDGLAIAYEMRRTARGALSAPARNCDVGTAKEQAIRKDDYCLRYSPLPTDDCDACPLRGYNRPNPEHMIGYSCDLAWAQLPYEAEGGRP